MSEHDVLLAIPNISEGRDTDLIARIAGHEALDVHSDPDHNRSVITYGGEPDDVMNIVYAMIERALRHLDIRAHEGAHPRFGIVDVLPLVAYRTDEQEAQRVAAELSWLIARGPGIPVRTYGRFSPDNRSLPELRRTLQTGEGATHPSAGVICLGIRDALVAFNVNLDASFEDAKRIAREVRSGAVRALAFDLPSRALVQVSMNLVDPLHIGPLAAFRSVAKRARSIVDAEIVGLVPQEALEQLETLPLRLPARSIEQALANTSG